MVPPVGEHEAVFAIQEPLQLYMPLGQAPPVAEPQGAVFDTHMFELVHQYWPEGQLGVADWQPVGQPLAPHVQPLGQVP